MTQPATAVDIVAGATEIAGLAFLAGGVAGGLALLYRWYARETVPEGLTVLAGLATVAVYLNTTASLGQVIGGSEGLLARSTAIVNTVAFAAAVVTSAAGRRAGDRLAEQVNALAGGRELGGDVGRLVEAVGRIVAVTLPDEIEDIEEYDPVSPGTKEVIAGKTLVFPGRLTVAELRDRLVTRLKDDYGVGHVDVDLADDGSVEYLAVGSRASGLGPTLAPGTVARAIRADPAFSASAGDAVQVWQPGPEPERVATGELRSTAGDVATLALDAPDAAALDAETRYRLVTLPAEPRIDREFASLLRGADETMSVASIGAGSPLAGTPIGALDVTVVAVRTGDGSIVPIPSRERALAAGDTVYAVARPEQLRRLEVGGTAAPQAEPS